MAKQSPFVYYATAWSSVSRAMRTALLAVSAADFEFLSVCDPRARGQEKGKALGARCHCLIALSAAEAKQHHYGSKVDSEAQRVVLQEGEFPRGN